MKKKIIIYVLILIIVSVSAACDAQKEEFSAENITILSYIVDDLQETYSAKEEEEDDDDDDDVKLLLETEHFLFYCSKYDNEFLKDLSESLETKYQEVTVLFDYYPDNKISVYIWPTINRFHNEIGAPGASEYFRAYYYNGALHSASPDFLLGLPIDKVLSEELTHELIERMGGYNVPQWLHEGIAGYMAGLIDINYTKSKICNYTKQNLPSFDELTNCSFNDFFSKNGYELSHSIALFLIENYGFDKINAFIQNPHDYSKAFGVTKEELWDHWAEYIEDTF